MLVRHLSRFTIAASVALLLSWFFPSMTQAACGDHVLVGSHINTSQTTHTDRLNIPREERSLPLPKRPCSGPTCSSVPERIPALPPPIPTRGANQWAAI